MFSVEGFLLRQAGIVTHPGSTLAWTQGPGRSIWYQHFKEFHSVESEMWVNLIDLLPLQKPTTNRDQVHTKQLIGAGTN